MSQPDLIAVADRLAPDRAEHPPLSADMAEELLVRVLRARRQAPERDAPQASRWQLEALGELYELIARLAGAEPIDGDDVVCCTRCGREGVRGPDEMLPPGWEGQATPKREVVEAICPGCQSAIWHPHCRALVEWESGEVVNPAVDWANMPREEIDFDTLHYCDYIDTTIAVTLDDEWPQRWTCPECGTEHKATDDPDEATFEWVHADYPPSGLPGAEPIE